jgi:Fe-S-cluster formation regulator IscX/YfhJ
LLDLGDDEDVSEELDDESDEPDPTLGRYEELHVEILDAEEVDAQRAAAESEGLSGPHKIFPHDPAGPGSLAETLARLEADGRVTSRVCDDADSGFYILYEPASKG